MYTRKELNGMFTEGQLVIYGGEGVCRIAAVGPSSLSGTDKTKLYYTLTPLTRSGTVLTPVDTKVLMRPILTRQEAESLLPTRAEFICLWRYLKRQSAGQPILRTLFHALPGGPPAPAGSQSCPLTPWCAWR